MPNGFLPGRVSYRITRSLDDHSGFGVPIADNVGYGFSSPLPSGRQSLSPDSSYYTGPLPLGMGFVRDNPPDFAAEVRSENDYGPAKDREYAAKRKDYFFAGTQVVWDVDPVAKTVTVYRADDPADRGETRSPATWPTPSRRCPAGGWPSPTCSFDIRPAEGYTSTHAAGPGHPRVRRFRRPSVSWS